MYAKCGNETSDIYLSLTSDDAMQSIVKLHGKRQTNVRYVWKTDIFRGHWLSLREKAWSYGRTDGRTDAGNGNTHSASGPSDKKKIDSQHRKELLAAKKRINNKNQRVNNTPFAKSNGRFFQTQKSSWCPHPICIIFGRFMECMLVVISSENFIHFWH